MTTSLAQPPQPPLRTRHSLARKIVIDLTIMTAIGVILAFIGPFGSFEEPLGYRLVSWVGFSWIGYAIYSPMGPLVDRVAGALDLPTAPLWVVAAAASSLPMTAAVYAMGYLPGPVPWPSLEVFFTRYPYVFVIGGGVTALFYMLETRKSAAPQPAPADQPQPDSPAPAVPNPLLDALPPALGSDIIALEMEDHYVRVHTALGSELVLMRLLVGGARRCRRGAARGPQCPPRSSAGRRSADRPRAGERAEGSGLDLAGKEKTPGERGTRRGSIATLTLRGLVRVRAQRLSGVTLCITRDAWQRLHRTGPRSSLLSRRRRNR